MQSSATVSTKRGKKEKGKDAFLPRVDTGHEYIINIMMRSDGLVDMDRV